MKLITKAPRRMITAAAIASAAALLPAVALASSAGSGQAAAAQPRTVTLVRASARPHCARSRLTAWIGIPGSGAAGSIYYPLEISNISHRTCTLYGFPGVSALSANGRQLGSAAGRARGYPELTVTLRPGRTAHAVLQIVEVGNFPRAACRPATAYTLRVYAPGDLASMRIPFSFRACRRSGPVYLHVSTTISGTGIPGYDS